MKKFLFLLLLLTWSLPALAGMNLLSGNVSHRQTLFAAQGGVLPLRIELMYNSLDKISGVLGAGWSHSYDIYLHRNSDGTIVLTGGIEKHFYFVDGSGYQTCLGDSSILVHNGDDTWTVTFRSGLQYRFGTDRKLAAIIDRYGNTVHVSHTIENGAVVSTTVIDPAGRSATIHYSNGKIDWIKDPAQRQYDFTYHATTGKLESVTSPAPEAAHPTVRPRWDYRYTASGGYLEYISDPEGHISKYGYTNGKVTRQVDPEGVLDMNGGEAEDVALHSKSLQYDVPAAGQITVTEKDGGQWLYHYDANEGVLTAKIAPDGSMTSYGYYAANEAYPGLRKEIVSTVDATTVLVERTEAYDSYGNPTVVKILSRPAGGGAEVLHRHLIYSYGSYDRITSVTENIAGTTVTLDYALDNGEEIVTVAAPKVNAEDQNGPQTVLIYRADGQLRQVTDPLGRVTSYAYDAAGLPQSITDETSGIVTSFEPFDALGRPGTVKISKSGQADRITNIFYDALGRPTDVSRPGVVLNEGASVVTLPTRFDYDLVGNRTSVTDAEDRTTTFEHNYRGDVTRITDALLHDTVLEYGGAGCSNCGGGVDKLTAVIDANQVGEEEPLKTSFHYDQSGNLEREEDPLGKALVYTWYPSGQLKQKIDETSGQVLVAYTYLPDGRLDTKTVRDAAGVNQVTDFDYFPNGRLQSIDSPTIDYTFTYYDNGWLKSVDDDVRTVTYVYDAAGRRELVTVTLNQDQSTLASLDYGYDPATKQLRQIVSAAGTFTFGYDDWGRRSTLTYPNGMVATYGYNGQTDWLTGIDYTDGVAGPVLLDLDYPAHDKVGNRKQRVEDGIVTSYAYDDTYQLTQAKTGASEENFTFDAVGNRESGPTVKDTPAAAYEHDAANRMLEGRKFDYAYDDRGNLRFRYLDAAHSKYWEYRWDGENRMSEAVLVDNENIVRTVTFKHDSFGRRIEKQVTEGPTTTTHTYVYDGEDIILETVSDGTTTISTHYVHGPGIDEPLALVRSGQNYFYHADGLGSIVAISDSNKAFVQRYTYESFGMLTASNPAFENPYTFTSREYDRETGLYYYRARYYDAMEGRFISKDPIGFEGGDVNLYRYVWGSPVNSTDSTGLWGDDVHSGIGNSNYGTYTWSRQAGLSESLAQRVAIGNVSVDKVLWASPWPPASNQSRHFNRFSTATYSDSRLYYASLEYKRAIELYNQGECEAAFGRLGKGLHSLQDYYAHHDWDPGFVGINPHPSWYDEWYDTRNNKAAIMTQIESIKYIKIFINEVNY